MMGHPAVWWADQVTWARRCQAQAESYARTIGDAITNPSDPYAAELRRSRRAAALAEVEAWGQYARDAETAFQSAAEAEMTAADERQQIPNTVEGAPGDLARQVSRSYDDSFTQLHSAGRCRSLFCCGEQDAS